MNVVNYTARQSVKEPSCEHGHNDIRKFTCSNGTIQYVKQCLLCGEKVGNPIKKEDAFKARGALDFILPFEELLRERMRFDDVASRREAYESARAANKMEFVQRYSEYLSSEKWRRKRNAVINRAGGVCEGCLETDAEVVHHTTYAHWGNELLFELVALCHNCHDRAHGK